MRCCKSQHRKHEHERNGTNGYGEHHNAVVCKKHGVHYVPQWNSPSRIVGYRTNELAGQRFPQRRGFQGQRYGAGIKLPDLPADLAQCRRYEQVHDACMARYGDLIP